MIRRFHVGLWLRSPRLKPTRTILRSTPPPPPNLPKTPVSSGILKNADILATTSDPSSALENPEASWFIKTPSLTETPRQNPTIPDVPNSTTTDLSLPNAVSENVNYLIYHLKAKDVVVIDMRHKCTWTEWMVLSSGVSETHVRRLADGMLTFVKTKKDDLGVPQPRLDGDGCHDWKVLDMGSMVMHFFTQEARERYNLEELWSNVNMSSEGIVDVPTETQPSETAKQVDDSFDDIFQTKLQMASFGLNAQTVLKAMRLSVVPKDQRNSDTKSASSTLKGSHDTLALLFHSIMVVCGFRLVGLGETGDIAQASEDVPSDDLNVLVPELPAEWNASRDIVSFRYKHQQSAMTFLIKCTSMANKLIVMGIAIEDGRVYEMQIDATQYVADSVPFPVDLSNTAYDENCGGGRRLFRSAEKLDDLVYEFKVNLLHKLIPGLTKLGYEPATQPSSSSSTRINVPRPDIPPRQPPMPRPGYDPLMIPPRPRHPFTIGDRDLDPFAAMGPPHPGGGMFVGPDHPMFGGDYSMPRPFGGGPGMLPPGAVPPGARFDPIMGGPLAGRPPFPGSGLAPVFRPPGQGQGQGRGQASGDPDFDDLPPPGYNDMYM